MTAKILLGAVVLAAIAGSPIAYNHFTSSTGGTQQEGDNIEAPQEERRLVSSQTPEEQPLPPIQVPPAAPHEAREDNPRADEVLPPANPVVVEKDPKKNDECGLGERKTWDGIKPFSKEMHCVRDTITRTRTPA